MIRVSLRSSACILLLFFAAITVTAQPVSTTGVRQKKSFSWKDLRCKLNDDGSHYIKFTVVNQVWLRFNESNPGTLVANRDKPYTFDIGLRRLRLQMIGQVSDRFFVYLQFGMNNFNSLAPRKAGDFFHDALVEYTPWKRHLSIGAGLSSWSNFARYGAPAVGSILMADAPIFEQATNDATDQFVRRLQVYVKGKFGKLDYRFALSDPFVINTSALFDPNISTHPSFTPNGHSLQGSGYLMYQFFDEESNQLPYMTGSYLGSKKVLNLGAGFEYQPDALWSRPNGIDTLMHNMLVVSGDIFYDSPLGKKKDMAITAYGAYTYYDFGPGYIRNVGVMNPANQLAPGTTTLNGTGSAFPMIGTGHSGYAQVGFMLPKHWFGQTDLFTIQPYTGVQLSFWDRLKDPMLMADAGLNFLFEGQRYKLSLHYQNRPVFDATSLNQTGRRSMAYLQLQIAL